MTAFHSKKPRISGAFFCQEPSALLFGILYSYHKIGKGITGAPVCTLHKMKKQLGTSFSRRFLAIQRAQPLSRKVG